MKHHPAPPSPSGILSLIMRRLVIPFCIIVVAGAFSPPLVHSQAVWQGSVNNSWATTGNWSGGAPSTVSGAPSQVTFGTNDLNGDALTLDGAYYLSSLVIGAANYGVPTKELASPGTTGSKLVFQANAGVNPVLTFNMMSTDLVGSINLTISADMEVANHLTLTRLGAGNLTSPRRVQLNGVISGGGDITINTTGSSSGQSVTFYNHNTFTGDVYMQTGYIAQRYADSLGASDKTIHFGDVGAVTWDLTSSDISAANGGTTIGYNIALSSLTGGRTLLLHAGTALRQMVIAGDITGGPAASSTVSLHLIAQSNEQLIFQGETMDFSGTVRMRFGSEVVVAKANAAGVAWENVATVLMAQEILTAGTNQSGFFLRGNHTFNGNFSVADFDADLSFRDKASIGQINHQGTSYDATFNGDIAVLENDYRTLNLVSESSGSATFNGDITVTGEQGMEVNGIVNATTSGGTLKYYEAAPTGTVVIGEAARVASTASGTGSIGVTDVRRGTLLVNTGSFYSSVDVQAQAHLGGIGTITGDVYLYGGAVGGTLAPGQGVASPIGSMTVDGTVYVNSGSAVVFDVKGATFNVGGAEMADVPSLFASDLDKVGDHDHLLITGALNVSGSKVLQFNTLNGYTPTWGDAFHLMDFGSLSSGALTYEDIWALPELADANWEWNFDLFYQHGLLVVTPEPSRALLILLAMVCAVTRRGRHPSVSAA